MTNEEAIKMMEREKTIVCFDCMHPQTVGYCEEVCRLPEAFDMAIEALKTVQEHEETFEWCTDCKEYDQDNHCCHRWTKQIRKTIKEWEEVANMICDEICFYKEVTADADSLNYLCEGCLIRSWGERIEP